jgi:hypothetical protein
MEIMKEEKSYNKVHLSNAWFDHRKAVGAKVNNMRKAMNELLSVVGDEHSHYALSDYDWDDPMHEEQAIFKAHRKWLKNIEPTIKSLQDKLWGRQNYRGHYENGVAEDLNTLDYGACPECGGFTEGDGESEADGCAADWVVVERSWSWCVGFGEETEFTGDCCSLKRRQQEHTTDSQRRADIERYSDWLLFGGMSEAIPSINSYNMSYMVARIAREPREEARKMVDEMCGIMRTSDYWVKGNENYPRQPYTYRDTRHDEDCEHRVGCGWSTSDSRIVQSGGWF